MIKALVRFPKTRWILIIMCISVMDQVAANVAKQVPDFVPVGTYQANFEQTRLASRLDVELVRGSTSADLELIKEHTHNGFTCRPIHSQLTRCEKFVTNPRLGPENDPHLIRLEEKIGYSSLDLKGPIEISVVHESQEYEEWALKYKSIKAGEVELSPLSRFLKVRDIFHWRGVSKNSSDSYDFIIRPLSDEVTLVRQVEWREKRPSGFSHFYYEVPFYAGR